ncbi:hypothetical protein PR048_030367 [Dryococelus australis]|uniref:Uncharacterized protein n=1 Tax=Dryococelus australis TaxID=614101 RepID=A0ABQ9GBE5_9NEOP|nr:hypothetical protein PR048_030367 [Dryococelus australis]
MHAANQLRNVTPKCVRGIKPATHRGVVNCCENRYFLSANAPNVPAVVRPCGRPRWRRRDRPAPAYQNVNFACPRSRTDGSDKDHSGTRVACPVASTLESSPSALMLNRLYSSGSKLSRPITPRIPRPPSSRNLPSSSAPDFTLALSQTAFAKDCWPLDRYGIYRVEGRVMGLAGVGVEFAIAHRIASRAWSHNTPTRTRHDKPPDTAKRGYADGGPVYCPTGEDMLTEGRRGYADGGPVYCPTGEDIGQRQTAGGKRKTHAAHNQRPFTIKHSGGGMREWRKLEHSGKTHRVDGNVRHVTHFRKSGRDPIRQESNTGRLVWRRGTGMLMGGEREIPEKSRRPEASSGKIPTCQGPGATLPGFEPDLICTVQRYDRNTERLAHRSDEAIEVRVTVACIAPLFS